MIFRRYAPLALALLLVSAAARSAPAGQAAANAGTGKQLFQGMCGRCHGIDGTGEEGPNLARPTLTRATDDESLRAIIRDGIPDRGMPRIRRMTDTELDQLVAYVRLLGRSPAATSTGNAQRGGEIYKRLGCASCHIIQGQGSSFGPDLTEIGASRGSNYLRQSFLGPAEMLPRGSSPVPGRGFTEYLPVHVVTSDGKEVTGVRINEDPFTIQLRDTSNRFHSLRKSDLKQLDKEFGKSLMPSFRGRLSDAENEDLVAFLAGLRGAQ